MSWQRNGGTGMKFRGLYIVVPSVSASISSMLVTARMFVVVGTATAAFVVFSANVSTSGVICVEELLSMP